MKTYFFYFETSAMDANMYGLNVVRAYILLKLSAHDNDNFDNCTFNTVRKYVAKL